LGGCFITSAHVEIIVFTRLLFGYSLVTLWSRVLIFFYCNSSLCARSAMLPYLSSEPISESQSDNSEQRATIVSKGYLQVISGPSEDIRECSKSQSLSLLVLNYHFVICDLSVFSIFEIM